jgi:ABC-type lipoprotein release transport system permease subunit
MELTSLIRHGGQSALRDWKRSGWLIAGVMLGIAFYVAVASIGASYTELVKLPFSRIESDLIIQLGTRGRSQTSEKEGSIKLPFSNQAIDRSAIDAIGSLAEIKKLATTILLWHQERKSFITIAGIDPADTTSGPAKVMQWISEGRALQGAGEAVVESHYAKFNKLKIGTIIHFNNRSFTIVGKTKIKEGATLAAANFYISTDDARELGAMEDGSANLLSATFAKGVQKESVKEKIRGLLPGSIVSSTDSIGEMMQGFARISSTSSKLLAGIALVFTVLLGCWLIAGRQQEQRWQIGLMQTLGWEKKDIILTYGAQAVVLTITGAIAGIVLGLLIIFWMSSLEVSLTLPWNLAPAPEGMQHVQSSKTMQVPLPIVLQPLLFFFGIAITCLTTMVTGIWSAARLADKGVRDTLFEQ